MRLDKRRLILVLLLVFIAVATVIIAQQQEDKHKNAVKNFTVEDVPNDDGTGLMLSWEPLPRDSRVIEYRIYRGVSPDTLFFHAAVQVNPKSGVTTDKMYYYDTSYNPLIDIESPGKLKKEKQQDADSPLYRKVPRDEKIAAELSKKLSMISIIENKDYYYKSDKVYSADEADSTAYAGLKMYQQMIYAALQTDQTYYYSVVAVNERNSYLGYAPVQSGVPLENKPEPATDLYVSLVEDGGKINFEWQYPIFKDDLGSYQIYMLPSGMDEARWNAMRDTLETGVIPAKMVANGALGGGSLKNYAIVEVTNLMNQGIGIDDLKNAQYAIEFTDYAGKRAVSHMVSPRIITAAQLPPQPSFVVEDKPNDKGDRLTVIWDDPVVFITKTSIINKQGSKMRVNYQLNSTDTQKVSNIYFDFALPGQDTPFTRINEYYQDDTIVIDVPEGYDYKEGFKVRITMDVEPAINEEYVLEQELKWDDQMLSLMPARELYRNGVEVSKLSNVVYRKTLRGSNFSMIKPNTSYDNNLDVVISYPSTITRGITGFRYVENGEVVTVTGAQTYRRPLKPGEKRGNFTLVSSDIDLVYDKEAGTTLMTSIFTDEAEASRQETISMYEERIAGLKEQRAQLAELPADQSAGQLAQIDGTLDSLEKTLAAYQGNDYLIKANELKGRRNRMHYIASVREPDSRYQTYMIARTDNRGAIVESELDLDADGEIRYHIPISNWFDQNKWTTLFASLIFGLSVFVFVHLAKRGKSLYIRPIAGLHEIDNAIGRATEMGRPMLYSMGNGGLSDVATLASLGILGLVAKKAAEYDTKLIVPCYNYIIMPIAQEIVREAHYAVGRPDSYDKNNIFFLTDMQFAYVAGFNGIMVRERAATNFFMGFFAAESLLMTETGNAIGAIQVAGTDAVTQIPFFITSCDYTLIGEELYAASAYLNREPMLLGTLKAQDYFKFLILSFIIVGAILSSFQITFINNLLPLK